MPERPALGDLSRKAVWGMWPIALGDIWQVGPHRVLCADFREAGGYGWLLRLFTNGREQRYVGAVESAPYTSPQSFTQRMVRAGRGLRSVNMDAFAYALAEHAARVLERTGGTARVHVTRPLRASYAASLDKHGFRVLRGDEKSRLPRKPSSAPRVVLRAVFPAPSGREEDVGEILYDPVCGKGRVLRDAAEQGLTAYGVDPDPYCCAIALDQLRIATGDEPQPLDD